jgi:Na+-driven multidrug efflux pump
LSNEAVIIVNLFCTWIAFSFVFNGYQFIANAAFNNLGYAHYATIFNFAKATLGTIPFVYIGSELADASGVLIGQAIGTVLIGSIAILVSFRLIAAFDQGKGPTPDSVEKPFNPRITLWPQSNIRG